jgi:RNA polymerase sigma-70 factor (ECF subfamily)
VSSYVLLALQALSQALRPLSGGSVGAAEDAKDGARVDAKLIRRSKRGGSDGRAAFSDLVRRHQSWLVRYLIYLLGDRDAAEDVAQDAFARAFLHLSSLRDPRTFKGWLRRTATRLAFNQRRDQATRRKYEEQAATTGASSVASNVAEREAILLALERLSYPYREVLVLYYLEELSTRELAQLLDIGVSAAKMRLSRARQEFQAIYTRETGDAR